MRICAIVCEYNPLHTGHSFQLDYARRSIDIDAVLCVMSGNFTQRAEPSIVDKYVRAFAALKNGADMVIELPTPYAVAAGDKFAFGAADLITKIKDVKYIAMGCEDDNQKIFEAIARVQTDESADFKIVLNDFLSKGLPYPSAYAQATMSELSKQNFDESEVENIINKPNNLLCIEYIKSLMRLKSDIEPVLIKRKGANHNDTFLRSDYASATSLRRLAESKDFTALTPYIPQNYRAELINELKSHAVDLELFEKLILYNLKTLNESYLGSLFDSREGIEIKLKKNALLYNDLKTVLEQSKSKRYTLARLRRICIQSLLDITKDTMAEAKNSAYRLLGIKEDFRHYIGKLPDCVYIKNSDNAFQNMCKLIESTEKRAESIYPLLTNKNRAMFSSPLVIV